ncbi:MAG: folylpolyglutamate synthase/dihydrofolate synthase family protein [bacterium]
MEKYLASLEKFGINLGLERISFLLENLGNPQNQFKSIHVAGTNGKGSTCSMIASILKEAGYKVGLYTSPHLFDYTERFKINGRDISKKELNEGLKLIRQQTNQLTDQPTVFEVLTAVAFWWFAKKKVDYAVIEVGMGGRLDATNVITPLVSVITNIDLEHTAILGDTLAKIAAEKAAIIKPGVPVVTAEIKKEPLSVIKKYAQRNNAIIFIPTPSSALPTMPLTGAHQKINAACAVEAIKAAGIKVSRNNIKAGFRKVIWPARFQVVSKKPLTIVDGAHNPAGVRSLIGGLSREFGEKKFSFIVGVQKDKDAKKMIRLIKPLAKEIIAVRSSHHNSAEEVAGLKPIALKKALAMTKGKDRIMTGSLFLAADALRIIRGEKIVLSAFRNV